MPTFMMSSRERPDHDPGRLDEPGAGLLHGNAEACVLGAGRPAAEPEQAPPARQHVEERDLLGHAYGIVPGQDD
ncbi:MAG TPA: hypothetical protein VFW70_22210, partial [Methylomirabilota bacterium]|nr:hypothetical protein [Methylomirabilota bacterium]